MYRVCCEFTFTANALLRTTERRRVEEHRRARVFDKTDQGEDKRVPGRVRKTRPVFDGFAGADGTKPRMHRSNIPELQSNFGKTKSILFFNI